MKKIKTVTIFVLFGFLLKLTYEGSDSQCHKDVAKTVISVKRCPVSAKENEIAALRKACNQIPNECASFVYHCLVNRFFNDTYEFCAPAVQIVYYLCAEFNKGGGVIQNSQHKEGHCKTCPIAYYSSESYKFRECYDRVMREVDNISNTQKGNQDSSTVTLNTDSSTEITTINSTFVNDDTEKTEDHTWIIPVAGFVAVFSVAVCCCIYYRRRICRKGDYMAIKGKETNVIVTCISETENDTSSKEVIEMTEKGEMEHSSLRSGEDSFKDTVTCISETENDTSSKEVIGMTEKEPLMTSTKERAYQIKKYKEEWVRKVKSQQRRRCLSENDSKEYIPLRRSSDDLPQGIGLNELQENTPLSERKNARIKDSQESLKGCENQNLHSAFGASGSVFDEVNACEPPQYSQPVRSENKREDRKHPEFTAVFRNVKTRRRVKSESEASDVTEEEFSKLLSSIPEVDNIGKQSNRDRFHSRSPTGRNI